MFNIFTRHKLYIMYSRNKEGKIETKKKKKKEKKIQNSHTLKQT